MRVLILCLAVSQVGFVSDLPHELVEAFKATLEEVVEADLILHVLDASSKQVMNQRDVVLRLLEDLGVSPHRLNHHTIEVRVEASALQNSPSLCTIFALGLEQV